MDGDLSFYRHVMIDSTYLRGRRPAVTVVMDAVTNTVVAGVYDVHESAASIARFFAALAGRGLSPISITTDGHPALLRYLRRQWPATARQRCLVHIQRQGLSWCRLRPTRPDAQQLRRLFLSVTTLCTVSDRDHWIDRFLDWEQRHGWRIDLTPEHGYVFSDLKRARSLIVRALPDMFHYLSDPAIAHTTNGLEGYFSRLKMRYRQHRGLSPKHRSSYIQWYLYWCPK